MLPRRTPWFLLAVGVGFLLVIRTTAADVADKAPPAKPATVKVEKSNLTSAVVVKGAIDAGKSDEVSVKPKAWLGPLVIKKVAVEHGAPVKKGDVLLEFDGEKLDQMLRETKLDRAMADLSIRQSELELPILEKQLPLDLAAAEREAKNAADDLARFLEVDKPQSILSTEFQLKSSAFNLDYSRDELKQLQKMYKDKDLTEETEEMVLKRQKHSLEMAEYSSKQSKIFAEQSLKVTLPRREITARDAATKAEIALLRAKDSLPLAFNLKKLGFEKLKYEEAKSRERLNDLQVDRAALTVTAPADGIAYYGRSIRGNWSGGANLIPGGTVQPGEVFVTVVAPSPLTVRAEVDEKDLRGLKAGLEGKATATAFPDAPFAVKVNRVGAAPLGGKFELRLDIDGAAAGVVPGMTCSVRLVTAQRKDALSLPSSAVFADDGDEPSNFVYLPNKSDKVLKRSVKVGSTFADRVEIIEGLKLGEEVLASKP